MRAALFDSSIYLSGMRGGDDAILSLRRFSVDAPLWLSAVVFEELYAGASGRVRQSLERMERDFDRVKRILVPTLADWTQAGRVLARLAARYATKRSGRDVGRTSATSPGSPNSVPSNGKWLFFNVRRERILMACLLGFPARKPVPCIR